MRKNLQSSEQHRSDGVLDTNESILGHYYVLVQESHNVFEVISADGTIKYISQALERVTGYTPEERIGRKAYELLEDADKIKFIDMMDFVISHPDQQVYADFSVTTRWGQRITLEMDMRNQLSEPSVQGIIVNWREKSTSDHFSGHQPTLVVDGLTKLPNRAVFDYHLAQAIALAGENSQTLGLMVLDVDRFKYYNGYLGYELSDRLLCQISERLKTALEKGEYLYRFSGDQFAYIMCKGNREDYENRAKEILQLFDSPFHIDNYKLDVSAKVGISIYPCDTQDMDSLIKYANLALLRVRGRAVRSKRYEFYSPLIDNDNQREFLLRNDLYKALEENQFKVYYQPLVDLHTLEVIAVEALLRWEHPECGMVSPAEFIPLMEETGFIVKIGKWLLEKVCRNYKSWQSKGFPPVRVSINHSPIQFAEDSLVENIQAILNEYQVDPRFLIIEITENVLIDNDQKVISNIQRLREMGIMVAVDDFGTGFSCLAYLSKYKIDILKIDRSFVQKIPGNRASTVITRSIIDLARELKIKLVAEGIETADQLAYLQMANCRTGQGYLFSKPVPRREIEIILARRKCQVCF